LGQAADEGGCLAGARFIAPVFGGDDRDWRNQLRRYATLVNQPGGLQPSHEASADRRNVVEAVGPLVISRRAGAGVFVAKEKDS
jgi:hypothetical protein